MLKVSVDSISFNKKSLIASANTIISTHPLESIQFDLFKIPYLYQNLIIL